MVRPLQYEIITTLGVKQTINPKQEIRRRIDFLKEYLKHSKAKGFVLGVSGGQDSTLAGKLAQIAINELKDEGLSVKFIAIRLPYGDQRDEEDAQKALDFISPDEFIIFNIKPTVDKFKNNYTIFTNNMLSDFHKGNVKARVRMITQYAIGGENNLLVIGTDHAAEAITGFFTKYGDGGADILPLSGLTKRQGKAILKELNAPKKLYEKIPTADLLDETPQQTDETELGLTYDQIDDFLEERDIPEDIAIKIEKRYLATMHKRELPATLDDDWWY